MVSAKLKMGRADDTDHCKQLWDVNICPGSGNNLLLTVKQVVRGLEVRENCCKTENE